MRNKLLGMLAIGLVLALVVPGWAQRSQLLDNVGFENWTAGPSGPPDAWRDSTTRFISPQEVTIVRGGTKSVRLTWDTTATQIFLYNELFSVTEGQIYACTLYVNDSDNAGRVRFFLDYTGTNDGISSYTSNQPGWEMLAVTDTIPAGITSMRLEVRMNQETWDGNATVYIDDMVLWGPTPPEGNIPPVISSVLRYPFPNVFPTDDVNVRATITDDSGLLRDSMYIQTTPGLPFAAVPHDSIVGTFYWYNIGMNPIGTLVEYYVIAIDDSLARTQSSTSSYTVISEAVIPTPIYAIQHTTNEGTLPDNCFPSDSAGLSQAVTGIVVGRYERTGGSPLYHSRFLMQDATTPWSGLNVFFASDTVQVGDSVTVTGSIIEYFAETELQAITLFTKHLSGHTLPAPVVLTCAQYNSLDTCSVNFEPYEGMIIQINNLTLTSSAGFGDFWANDGGADSIIVMSDLSTGGTDSCIYVIGQTYSYVRGIGRYNFSQYKIAPRFSSDLYIAPLPCTGGSIIDVQFTFDPGSDTADCWPSPDTGTMVTVCGIVTAVTQGSQPMFYMQDQGNTTWGGIYCFDYRLDNGDTVDVHIGDYIQVTSHAHEYFGWTELDSISEFTTLGTNQPLPDTFLVTVANFAGLCDIGPEPYEDILIRINSVTVLSDNGFGELWIRDNSGPDSIRIDSDLWFYGTNPPNPLPSPGATYDWIVGVVKWQGRQGAGYERGWIILPRIASDYEQGIIPEPEIADVWSINSTSMAVSFDRVMDPVTTQIPGNYSTTHGLSITGAVLDPGGRKVVLTTGTQPNNMVDSIITVNLCDNLGTCMSQAHYGLFHSGFTSLSVVNLPNAGGDSSTIIGHVVTLKGWIVADSSMNHPTNFFLNDPGTPAPGGILGYSGGFVGTLPFLGDTVIVTGRVDEYFMATELINLGTFNNYAIVSSSGPDPVPYHATVAELNANREMFEGVLVTVCDSFEITNLTPDTSVLQYGFMIRSLSSPTDSFFVHKQDVHTRYSYVPVVGAHIRGITGVYKFQRGQFRIGPRFDADINSFDTYCGGGVGCSYIPGDLNGIGGANGIDVTYGVTYLKGGTAPHDTCFNCPTPGDTLLAPMDVNGSCSANGIDITFFVAYLKLIQPSLKWCLDCPPATLIAPRQEIPSIMPALKKAKSSGSTDGIE